MLPRKKKIVAISTSYPLRKESVSGIFVHKLYAALAESWNVEVLCPDDSSDGSGGSYQGVNIKPVRYAPKRLQTLGGPGGFMPSIKVAPIKGVLVPGLLAGLLLNALIKARTASILHANWAVCGAIAAIAGLIMRIPTVTTLRGDDVFRAKKSIVDRFFLSIAVHGSGKVICVSKEMAEQLAVSFPKRRNDIEVCLNGVDDSFFKIQKAENTSGILRVACVGSLIPRKGYDVLIEAVALLKEMHPINVIIAGDGPDKSKLIHLAEQHGVLQYFEFIGEVDQSRVQNLFVESDVFVLASRSEGRPNAVIEAVASGLPVICSDLDGVNGLVTHNLNGWIFSVGDSVALAAALTEASADIANLKIYGQRGRTLLSVGAGWDVTARSYSAVFQSLLHAKDSYGDDGEIL